MTYGIWTLISKLILHDVFIILLYYLVMSDLNHKAIDPNVFIEQSRNGMMGQQKIHMNTWGLNDPDNKSWEIDLEKGVITFTFPDKIVTANVQVVGTLYNGTFMWGWEHPSVPFAYQNDALLAKRWGEENGLAEYTTQVVPADETKAWDFTAVAARLSNATGTYSGKTGETRVFVTFGPVTIAPIQKN